MSCSIFIRSHRADREWLSYCLRSLEKFAKGFDEIVVVLPSGDEPHFDKFDPHGARIQWTIPDGIHGYLAQQKSKLTADQFVKSDWILFVDSDCFATKEFTPFGFGLPVKGIQLIRKWEDVDHAQCWKEPTKKALGFEPAWEHMATLPLIYHRSTLEGLRDYFQKKHNQTIEAYISSLNNLTFSEFNVLGAYAQMFQPHLYDWRIADPERDGYCRRVKQFWSHNGVETHREEFERSLAQ